MLQLLALVHHHRHHQNHHISASLPFTIGSGSGSVSFTLVVVTLLLVTTAELAEGVYNHSCTAEQMVSERRGKVCGSNIPKTLDALCGLRGTADRHQPCRGKRGVWSLTKDNDLGFDDKGVFLSKERALAVLRGATIKRAGGAYQQGIVCECCVHQCSLKELQEYCNSCSRRTRGGGYQWSGGHLHSGERSVGGSSGGNV